MASRLGWQGGFTTELNLGGVYIVLGTRSTVDPRIARFLVAISKVDSYTTELVFYFVVLSKRSAMIVPLIWDPSSVTPHLGRLI